MAKKTKGCEDFENYINKPLKTKKYVSDHDKAVERIDKLSTPLKRKVKAKVKF